jgi:hypothetical protein
MVVNPATPPEYFGVNGYLWGVREQPPRTTRRVEHWLPNYGTFWIEEPGPVYVVSLEDATVALMSRETWARPVARSRFVVEIGPD